MFTTLYSVQQMQTSEYPNNQTIRITQKHLSAKILFPHLGVDPRDILAPALSIATSPLAITGRNQETPIFGTGTTGR